MCTPRCCTHCCRVQKHSSKRNISLLYSTEPDAQIENYTSFTLSVLHAIFLVDACQLLASRGIHLTHRQMYKQLQNKKMGAIPPVCRSPLQSPRGRWSWAGAGRCTTHCASAWAPPKTCPATSPPCLFWLPPGLPRLIWPLVWDLSCLIGRTCQVPLNLLHVACWHPCVSLSD